MPGGRFDIHPLVLTCLFLAASPIKAREALQAILRL